MRFFIWAVLFAIVVSRVRVAHSAPNSSDEYLAASKMIHLPLKLEIGAKGGVSFDQKKWTTEDQPDGTQLLTAKTSAAKDSNEVRAAVMRTPGGSLESVSSYKLQAAKAGHRAPEFATSLAFENEKFAAFTSCEDSGTKNSLGRICVTATPKLCHGLRIGEGITPEILSDLERHEMKALAIILTLRGSEHQLDNMVKVGNRLGLKSALQTTKGQLIAFAREIEKETGKSQNVPVPPREPASIKRESEDARLAKEVLETHLPRLKKACVDTGFST